MCFSHVRHAFPTGSKGQCSLWHVPRHCFWLYLSLHECYLCVHLVAVGEGAFIQGLLLDVRNIYCISQYKGTLSFWVHLFEDQPVTDPSRHPDFRVQQILLLFHLPHVSQGTLARDPHCLPPTHIQSLHTVSTQYLYTKRSLTYLLRLLPWQQAEGTQTVTVQMFPGDRRSEDAVRVSVKVGLFIRRAQAVSVRRIGGPASLLLCS